MPPPSPHRRYDLIAVGLSAVGLLILVALAKPGSAGPMGEGLVSLLRYIVGSGAWVTPLLLWALGLGYALDRRRRPPLDVFAGTAILFLLYLAFAHLRAYVPSGSDYHSELFSLNGGLIGAFLGRMMLSGLDRAGSYILISALSVASLLLITDAPLARTIAHFSSKGRDKARRAKERVSDWRARYDEEDDEAEEPFEAAEPASSRQRGKRALSWPPRLNWNEEKKEAAEGEEKDEEAPPPFLEDAEEVKPALKAVKRKTALGDFLPTPDEDEDTDSDILPVPLPSKKALPKAKPATRIVGTGDEVFELPSLDLLNPAPPPVKLSQTDREENIRILEETLADFKIDARVVEICHGPTVTRYEIRLAPGTYVKKIVSLADNIAMSLAAIAVRVEAPIPGKSAIGVEVPNRIPSPVGLRQIIETKEFMEASSPLMIALGADVANQPKFADITRMPHLLIGGSTNSGKSVCLNTVLCSLLFRATPEDVKLLLIDPKRVELALYDGIPHLLYPVVKDVRQAGGVLRWALKEMDRRYNLLVEVGSRNIDGYNKKRPEGERKLPYIVIVIDELADLMMQQGPEVEGSICRLAQLARAVGIHLIIATQRPSVDVITGTIKANISSRIAFAVASGVDSKTILDHTGAERLVGRGDMLFLPIDAPKAVRIQGAYISENEIEALVDHLKAQGAPDYEAEVVTVDTPSAGKDSESDDELFEQAVRLVVTTGHASTSMLQRKFNIGYGRAARLIDIMEEKGIVGQMNNAKPREILIPKEAVNQMFTHLGKAEMMEFEDEEE